MNTRLPVSVIIGLNHPLFRIHPPPIRYFTTVNPRISPLGAYLFFTFLDGGLFEGGTYTRGAYKIIVDIEKTLLKDLVYFSRNFSMSI